MKKMLAGNARLGSMVSDSLVTGEEDSHLPFDGHTVDTSRMEGIRIAIAEDTSSAILRGPSRSSKNLANPQPFAIHRTLAVLIGTIGEKDTVAMVPPEGCLALASL